MSNTGHHRLQVWGKFGSEAQQSLGEPLSVGAVETTDSGVSLIS
jgi:hypothetical protein